MRGSLEAGSVVGDTLACTSLRKWKLSDEVLMLHLATLLACLCIQLSCSLWMRFWCHFLSLLLHTVNVPGCPLNSASSMLTHPLNCSNTQTCFPSSLHHSSHSSISPHYYWEPYFSRFSCDCILANLQLLFKTSAYCPGSGHAFCVLLQDPGFIFNWFVPVWLCQLLLCTHALLNHGDTFWELCH